MAKVYGKFEDIERYSLSDLIDKLSFVSNLEYLAFEDISPKYKDSIKKAQKIEPKIKNIGDLNNYYKFLKEEIDKREKRYSAGIRLTHLIKKRIPLLLKELDGL